MNSGWFDRFSSQEVDRNIDSNGIVSYSITTSSTEKRNGLEFVTRTTKPVNLLEIFLMHLRASKKTLTPELKQVIDDIPLANLNDIWGFSNYTQKTPIGHAIDDINMETVEYLLQKGANVNVPGTNQKHVLQELLLSNATEKRVQILETILKHLNPNTIQITKGFDGKFYTIKYLIPIINAIQITDDVVEMIFSESTPKQRKSLISNCNRVVKYAKDDELPQEVRDVFIF
jgi:hypothetical protein